MYNYQRADVDLYEQNTTKKKRKGIIAKHRNSLTRLIYSKGQSFRKAGKKRERMTKRNSHPA
jgi:arsenate reductase-like glutaredoxin family protein